MLLNYNMSTNSLVYCNELNNVFPFPNIKYFQTNVARERATI